MRVLENRSHLLRVISKDGVKPDSKKLGNFQDLKHQKISNNFLD